MSLEEKAYGLIDYLAALKPLLVIICGITLIQVHAIVSTISVFLGLGYMLRKWYLMEKNVRNKKNEKP